jgi:hypothetical protein
VHCWSLNYVSFLPAKEPSLVALMASDCRKSPQTSSRIEGVRGALSLLPNSATQTSDVNIVLNNQHYIPFCSESKLGLDIAFSY